MKKRTAFTMLELLFAIVVLGILSKFGVEFLAQAYRGFIYTNINNSLQAQSANAVELIASRLQYRIKNSVIARHESDINEFYSVSDLNTSKDMSGYTILEWIGEDIDGLRGNGFPYWSGIFDLDSSAPNALVSLGTNTTDSNNLIQILSNGNTAINSAALYFVGSDYDITQMGWQGNYYDQINDAMLTFNGAINEQNQTMHPITITANTDEFAPLVGTFAGTSVDEYYKLSWTAYALTVENYDPVTMMGDLFLYYDYQPWMGESYADANRKKVLLAQNISTFRFISLDSLIKIQVCVKSNLLQDEEYSLCKDKTIF